MAPAIVTATAGVVIMAIKPDTPASLTATLLGLAAGAMFALPAVGFGGAILSVGGSSYVMAATLTVVVGLMLQSILLSLYLRVRDPQVLAVMVRAWRPSLFAGFMGALASQFWFLAFALATAASVRTLALVGSSFAIDRAVLGLAVVHLSRLVGKFPADIIGIFCQVIAQVFQLLAEVALLRRHHRDRGRPIGGLRGGGWHLRRRRITALFRPYDARCHHRLFHLHGIANRAGDQSGLDLLVLGCLALEPALEYVSPIARQLVADHARPRTVRR